MKCAANTGFSKAKEYAQIDFLFHLKYLDCMAHVTMERNTRTFLEKLDPRTKLFALASADTLILFSESRFAIPAVTLMVLAGILASPISLRSALGRSKYVLWFVIIITSINAVTVSGRVVTQFGGFYVTEEGLLQGLKLSARISLVVLLSFLFVRTTTVDDMSDAIESLLSPFRKRLGPVVAVLGLTLNFVPLLVRSAQRIKAAQVARGADVDSSFSRQVRFASQAVLPLFVSAFRSSQSLAEAMEARCYNSAGQRTPFSSLRMNRLDWGMITAVLFLSAAAIVLP